MTTFDEIAEANKCTQCGLCNAVDPILTAVHKESASTRFKMVLAKRAKTSPLYFLHADAGLQEQVCPAGIRIGEVLRCMRARNIAAGITTKANDEMLANFAKNGTPYANLDREDFFDKPVW